MKEIKAIIKPHRLDEVLGALRDIPDLPGVTVSTVSGVSTKHGAPERVLKTRIEIMVPDALAGTVARAIQRAAHTGNPGDGRIFVMPVEWTVKIRTGEEDTCH